jgi:hypothetical protein
MPLRQVHREHVDRERLSAGKLDASSRTPVRKS